MTVPPQYTVHPLTKLSHLRTLGNSLRIRVEAHADTTERTVIRQQVIFMQTRYSHALLKSFAQWSRLSGAAMSTRKHVRNARTGTSMVWCAMDSPTTNVYAAANSASACTEFWLWEYAWWTKVWKFSKLRSEPWELPRKHAELAQWSDFGGLTPQAAQIQEVMAMLGNLNEGQLQTVQQHMQDRFVTMQQRRGVPEVFGDGLGRAADSSFVTPQPFDVLPGFGVQQSNSNGNQQTLDVFAKSEKWLTPAPTPVGTWKTREEEVLGWAGYLDELSSWVAGGSLEFSVEIQHSSRWPGPIRWSALSGAQQARSRRLMSILKAALHDNPRCVALVNAFSEGVALDGVGSSDRMTVAINQQANRFELLRQLTLEFSLRSRSEALSLRTQIAGRSFVLAATHRHRRVPWLVILSEKLIMKPQGSQGC